MPSIQNKPGCISRPHIILALLTFLLASILSLGTQLQGLKLVREIQIPQALKAQNEASGLKINSNSLRDSNFELESVQEVEKINSQGLKTYEINNENP